MKTPHTPHKEGSPSDALEIRGRWTVKMTNDEWKQLSELRVFRESEAHEARRKIDALVIAFRMYQIEQEKISDYRKTVTAARSAVRNLEHRFSKVAPLSLDTEIDLDPHGMLVKHANRAFFASEHIRQIREALNLLETQLSDGLGMLKTHKEGPATTDGYWFVAMLNQIVMDHSDGGPLSRSDTDIRDKGNDVQFTKAAMALACMYTDTSVGPGTIIGAIRDLNVPLRPHNAFAFTKVIPEAEMIQVKEGKPILQSALGALRQRLTKFRPKGPERG